MAIEEYGKVPPQETEAEQAVLGACMIEDCFSEVYAILKPECFYRTQHEQIFASMVRLFKANKPLDLVMITDDCRSHGTLESIGGALYLVQLTNQIGSAANVEHHCLIVKEKWVAREIIKVSSNAIKSAYEDHTDPFELLGKTTQDLDLISGELQSGEQKDFYHTLCAQIEQIKISASKKEDEKYVIGLPTGLYTLDRKVLGWTSPDLIVIAGRPGEGKTSIAVQSANTMLDRGHPVGFLSAEMTLEQVNLKLLSINTDIDVSRLRTGALKSDEWDKVMEAKKIMSKYELKVFDKPVTADQAKALAKTWKKKHGIEAFIFDYIQRSRIPNYLRSASRNDQISYITNTLKDTALELEIPVIALSQMTRDIEKRSGDNQRPKLSDLRDGGCLLGETKIYLPRLRKIMRVEDLEHRKDFHILATDTAKNKIMKAKKCFSTGEKEVFELELINGMKINATSNHKFLTPEGWLPLSDLIGKEIAIPINYPDEQSSISDEEVNIIGHFLCNGSAVKRQPIRYTCNQLDIDLANKVVNDALVATNNTVAPKIKMVATGNSKCAVIFFKPTFHLTHGKRSPIADILRKYGLFDKRAKEKFIPDELFFLSNKQTCLLLKSLFSGDGCAYYKESKGRKSLKISYSSSSVLLIYGIQTLLQKVGIISFISKVSNDKNQTWYNLYLSGKSNIQLYVKNIGFWNKRKNDIMLDGWERSKDNLAGWNKYSFNEERTLCFMPVSSITTIGTHKVYDIEVDKVHNFTANNIIVHNSIEQDADIIIFVYRPQIHGIKQFADGSSTKDCTEFIIEKHRLGTHGAVIAKFIGCGNRFDDSDFSNFKTSYDDHGKVIEGNKQLNAFGKKLIPMSEAMEDDSTPF